MPTEAVEVPRELVGYPEAAVLWSKLLRRARPDYLRHFGIRDLAQRLEWQAEREQRDGGALDVRARAGIWYHVAEQCSPGESEIPAANEKALREWMPGEERVSKTVVQSCVSCGRRMQVQRDSRFTSCRKCRGARRGSEKVAASFNRTGELPEGWKLCGFCNAPFQAAHTDAAYCSQRCQKRAYRSRRVRETAVSGVVSD